MHRLNWYDYSARHVMPDLGRFTTTDPLVEKYYNISPYAYCNNNPIKYVDLRGDSISLFSVQVYDKQHGTNYLQMIINDLSSQTGLTYSVSSTGMLVYNKDSEGKAIISTDSEGNKLGSNTAREFMKGAVDHAETAEAQIVTNMNSKGERGGLSFGLNPTQISGFINGANGLDTRILGWGMTFMHELHHTKIGGGLTDTPYSGTWTDVNPGPVAKKMNVIRNELNSQGGNYGQRMTYPSYQIGGSSYISFDSGSHTSIMWGGSPDSKIT